LAHTKNPGTQYLFEVPKRLDKKKLNASAIRGGYCKSPKTIYVYGFGCEALDYDDRFYQGLVRMPTGFSRGMNG